MKDRGSAKKKMVSFRAPKDLALRLEREAKRQGKTFTEYMIDIVYEKAKTHPLNPQDANKILHDIQAKGGSIGKDASGTSGSVEGDSEG